MYIFQKNGKKLEKDRSITKNFIKWKMIEDVLLLKHQMD